MNQPNPQQQPTTPSGIIDGNVITNVPHLEKALGLKPYERLSTDQPATPPVVQGQQNVVAGGGATQPVTPQVTPQVAPQVTPSGAPATPGVTPGTTPAVTPQVAPQQVQLSDADRAKMFQHKFSVEEAARKKLEQEIAMLKQNLEFATTFIQNAALTQQMLAPQAGVAPVQGQPAGDGQGQLVEPQITEFISDYDPEVGVKDSDPRYRKFLKAQRDYERKLITQDVLADVNKNNRMDNLQKEGLRLCEAYPQYGLPNGQPNWYKIQQELGAFLSLGDLVKAKKFVDFQNQPAVPTTTQPDNVQTILQQIEAHATTPAPNQQIPSVVTVGPVSEQQPIVYSDDVKLMQKHFGRTL